MEQNEDRERRATGAPAGAERGMGAPRAKAWGVRGGEAPRIERRIVADSTDDFASLFEASIKAKRIERGQTVEGTIVAIGQEVAFVDVGGKGEASIDIAELKN